MKSFKQHLNENMKIWKLDPSLDKSNFHITNDFNDIKSWKATIVEPYSEKKGELDSVGYIMFNIKTHTFIPIAREDEHKQGYDVMGSVYKKPLKDWTPIWMLSGDYIEPRDKEIKLQIFKSLSEDGLNLSNILIRQLGFKGEITAKRFVDTGGEISHEKGVLSKNGQELIDRLKSLSKDLNSVRNDPMIDRKITPIYKKAKSLLDWFDAVNPNELKWIGSFYSDIDNYKETIAQDIQSIEDTIYGFNGFKNKIHLMLKNSKNHESTDAFFGDSELAKGMFDTL